MGTVTGGNKILRVPLQDKLIQLSLLLPSHLFPLTLLFTTSTSRLCFHSLSDVFIYTRREVQSNSCCNMDRPHSTILHPYAFQDRSEANNRTFLTPTGRFSLVIKEVSLCPYGFHRKKYFFQTKMLLESHVHIIIYSLVE